MRPKDFWALHPIEFWWIVEAKKPYNEMDELYEVMIAAEKRMKGK